MSLSDATEGALLALIFNASSWANYADNATASPETNIVGALHTADPSDAGFQNTSEIAYTNYARVNIPRNASGWSVIGNTASPVASISFPVVTGGSGTATHVSLGKSGGGASPILLSGSLTPNIVIGVGVTPSLSTATTITLD
jgi:hypothetical protein